MVCRFMVSQQLRSLTIMYRYSTEPFAAANGQIAQLNIWDDHDVCSICSPYRLGAGRGR